MSIIGKLQYTSTKNCMKRHESSGSGVMAAPNIDKLFSWRSYKTIPHNLGYVPLFRVYYEPYRNGRIMEAYNDGQNWIGATPNDFVGAAVAPTVFAYADEKNLYIELVYTDGSLAGSADYPVYWVIYQDYGVNP